MGRTMIATDGLISRATRLERVVRLAGLRFAWPVSLAIAFDLDWNPLWSGSPSRCNLDSRGWSQRRLLFPADDRPCLAGNWRRVLVLALATQRDWPVLAEDRFWKSLPLDVADLR